MPVGIKEWQDIPKHNMGIMAWLSAKCTLLYKDFLIKMSMICESMIYSLHTSVVVRITL